MRAAIYVSRPAGPAFELELAKARAYCERQGLVVAKVYAAESLRDKRQLDNFFAAVREQVFEVVVGPFPDCFPTRFLRQLIACEVGLACYDVGGAD